MHRYTVSHQKVWALTLVVLVLSLLIGGGILLANYRAWRDTSPAARARNGQRMTLLITTTVLSFVTILNSLVAFAGPKVWVEEESFREAELIRIYAPTVESAILSVVLTNITFACAALVTWVCYCMGKAIHDEAIPRWKVWLAHFYIWVVGAVNCGAIDIPTQITLRERGRGEIRFGQRYLVQGASWIVSRYLIHVCASGIFVITFVRSLNSLVKQVGRLDARRIEEMRALALKSIFFVVVSEILFLCAIFAFFAHPIQFQLNVTTPLYQLGMLVLIQGCFVGRVGLPCCRSAAGGDPKPKPQAPDEAVGMMESEARPAGQGIPEEMSEMVAIRLSSSTRETQRTPAGVSGAANGPFTMANVSGYFTQEPSIASGSIISLETRTTRTEPSGGSRSHASLSSGTHSIGSGFGGGMGIHASP